MTIRELLQIEIWSERTTRKLLIGFGIVVAAFGVGFVLWNTLDERWITPPERKAASAALVQIEVLQNFNQMSDAEYDARALQAKQKVDIAEQIAWTSQDKRIALLLLGYFDSMDRNKSNQKWKIRTTVSQQELDKKVLQFIKDVLQRALDQ